MKTARLALLVALALAGFAANSLLCRLALAAPLIDAGGFTAIRLASGAATLVVLVLARRLRPAGTWWSALALVAYAVPFSFAYLRVGAGVGALVLFAAVQTTMIGWGVVKGERPRVGVWLGLALAMAGLTALTLPAFSGAPDLVGVALMVVAGGAWGAYSLRGRAPGVDPLAQTAGNFARALPIALVVVAPLVLLVQPLAVSPRGALLAVASGALASGVGYSLWYAALPHLTAARAALLQLLVPALTALAAVVLLDEPLTLRVVMGGAVILGGVALALRARA